MPTAIFLDAIPVPVSSAAASGKLKELMWIQQIVV